MGKKALPLRWTFPALMLLVSCHAPAHWNMSRPFTRENIRTVHSGNLYFVLPSYRKCRNQRNFRELLWASNPGVPPSVAGMEDRVWGEQVCCKEISWESDW